MTSNQLANRLREVILDGTWIANTNYKAQIEGIDYKLANTKIHSFNTITLLAQHVHYYIAGIKNVFINNKLEIRDKYSFDFSPITTQKQWETFLDIFWKDTEDLIAFIKQLSNDQLKEPFVNEKYGNYLRNIDGLIEHAYYHLGQIVIIKKMINNNL